MVSVHIGKYVYILFFKLTNNLTFKYNFITHLDPQMQNKEYNDW